MLHACISTKNNTKAAARTHDLSYGNKRPYHQAMLAFVSIRKYISSAVAGGGPQATSAHPHQAMLRIKSRYQISNTRFNTLLKLLSSAFPQSKLPESYDEAKKYPRELGIGYDKIHVCKNNCVLFRKRYAKMDVCPKCKESRWEDKDGKCVPHKVLRHFPLILRLKRMFGSSKTAEDTQWQKKNGHQLIMN